MSLSKQFRTNSGKENDGVPVEYGENEDGTIPTFVISRMGPSNKAYSKALEAQTKPYRRQIELGTMNEETASKLFKGLFAGYVLKGWQNVLSSDVTGEIGDDPNAKAEFSKANAMKLFDRLPDVYDDLQANAKAAALFRDEETEADAKN